MQLTVANALLGGSEDCPETSAWPIVNVIHTSAISVAASVVIVNCSMASRRDPSPSCVAEQGCELGDLTLGLSYLLYQMGTTVIPPSWGCQED